MAQHKHLLGEMGLALNSNPRVFSYAPAFFFHEGSWGTLSPQAMLPQAWFQSKPSGTSPLLSVGSGTKGKMGYKGTWLPQAGGALPWVGANRNSWSASSRREEALESAASDPDGAGADQPQPSPSRPSVWAGLQRVSGLGELLSLVGDTPQWLLARGTQNRPSL